MQIFGPLIGLCFFLSLMYMNSSCILMYMSSFYTYMFCKNFLSKISSLVWFALLYFWARKKTNKQKHLTRVFLFCFVFVLESCNNEDKKGFALDDSYVYGNCPHFSPVSQILRQIFVKLMKNHLKSQVQRYLGSSVS